MSTLEHFGNDYVSNLLPQNPTTHQPGMDYYSSLKTKETLIKTKPTASDVFHPTKSIPEKDKELSMSCLHTPSFLCEVNNVETVHIQILPPSSSSLNVDDKEACLLS